MRLARVSLPDAFPRVAAAVGAFIADARARVDAFIESRANSPIPSFVPSDFTAAYQALRHIAESGLATGRAFCEWGSGLGAVACLAKMAGFDACGIEFESDLVEAARRLAADYRLDVAFYHGNIVPFDGQRIAEDVGEFEWLAAGGPDAYEEMGLEVDDFDVIFAYPWPGERRVIDRLFARFAAAGALLLTYDGDEGLRLQRKPMRGDE